MEKDQEGAYQFGQRAFTVEPWPEDGMKFKDKKQLQTGSIFGPREPKLVSLIIVSVAGEGHCIVVAQRPDKPTKEMEQMPLARVFLSEREAIEQAMLAAADCATRAKRFGEQLFGLLDAGQMDPDGEAATALNQISVETCQGCVCPGCGTLLRKVNGEQEDAGASHLKEITPIQVRDKIFSIEAEDDNEKIVDGSIAGIPIRTIIWKNKVFRVEYSDSEEEIFHGELNAETGVVKWGWNLLWLHRPAVHIGESQMTRIAGALADQAGWDANSLGKLTLVQIPTR